MQTIRDFIWKINYAVIYCGSNWSRGMPSIKVTCFYRANKLDNIEEVKLDKEDL